jgi:hypothetical protein
MPSSDTQFSSDNQPKRTPRGKAKKTLIIEALNANSLTEADFFDAMVKKAMFGGNDGDGDPQMMKEVAARLYPMSKATLPAYEFEFPTQGTMTEKADAIINAVGESLLPIDAARAFMDILETKASIFEKEELAERVAKLEELLSA